MFAQLVLIVVHAPLGMVARKMIWRCHPVVVWTHVLMRPISTRDRFSGGSGGDFPPLVRSGEGELSLDFQCKQK